MARESPWLVQRLKAPIDTSAQGLDAVARCDYMGSAEFEFGAVSHAVREMRAVRDQLVSVEVSEPASLRADGTRAHHVAYFVGVVESLMQAKAWFGGQLNDTGDRMKEASFVSNAYNAQRPRDFGAEYIGWLALDMRPPWALFRDPLVAKRWLEAIKAESP